MTFFFNGGLEQPHAKEDRKLVPSPRVPTYDLQPEMSAHGVAEAVSARHVIRGCCHHSLPVQMAEAMQSGGYPFVMCNFAPPDMVGHTGVYEAAVQACTATG